MSSCPGRGRQVAFSPGMPEAAEWIDLDEVSSPLQQRGRLNRMTRHEGPWSA